MTAQPELDLGIQRPKPTHRRRLEHPDGGEFPAWIRDQLKTNKKKPAPRHRTEHHYCPHCSEIVITGTYDLAATPGRAFLHTTIDPTPLDPQLELACLLAGRRTYRCRTHPTSIEIINSRLMRWEYTWRENEIVLPHHRCGARLPGFHTPPATKPQRTTSNDDDEGPTF